MSTWGPGSGCGLCAGTGTRTHFIIVGLRASRPRNSLSPVQVTSPQHIDTRISRIISFLLLTDLINGYPTVYSVQLKHFRSLDYKEHSQQYVRDISWYIFFIQSFGFWFIIATVHTMLCRTLPCDILQNQMVFFGAFLSNVVLADSEDNHVLRLCINYTFHRNKQNNNPFIIKYEKSHMTWSNSFFENTYIWCYDVFDIALPLRAFSSLIFYFFLFFNFNLD